MHPRLRTALPLLLLSACVAPPSATPVAVEIATAPSPYPMLASVTAVGVPERLVLDGDLAEWGSLLPPSLPPSRGGELAAPSRRGPSLSELNPRDVASRVAVAITGDGARIAAELGEAAREGLWLGIGSEPPEVPPVGEYGQVGGSVNEPEMGLTTPSECLPTPGDDAPYEPETDETCRAYRRRRADFEAAHKRRFQRFYQIDREGVRIAKDDGSLVAVEGAKVVFKPSATGATAEVSLPATALPRLHQAPLTRIRLVARAVTTLQPPNLPAERWVSLELPAPVGFEPWGDLRSHAFAASKWMSYQPGNPLHVETMRYPSRVDRRSVVVREEALYVKQATLGDAEIGYLTIAGGGDEGFGGNSRRVMLAILTKGAVAVAPIQGEPRVVTERDGELHVLAYAQEEDSSVYVVGTGSSFGTATYAGWSVIAVGPDGKRREVALDGAAVSPWDEVEELHDNDSFGVRGALATWAIAGETTDNRVELRWRWDRSKKTYVVRRLKLSLPQNVKTKKAKKQP